MSSADWQAFRDEVYDALDRIASNAFQKPFAGWRPGGPPFDRETLSRRSILPSWVCFESESGTEVLRFDRRMANGREGSEVISVGIQTYGQPPTPLCEEMRIATEGALSDVLRTLPSPRRVVEVVVEHDDNVHLDAGDPAMLWHRPDGVELVKQAAPEGVTAESASESNGGAIERAVHVSGGWQYEGRAEPASMPIGALDRSAWLHVWEIQARERGFGAHPTEKVLETTRLYAAFLATEPALRQAEPVAQIAPGLEEALPPTAPEEPPVDALAAIDRSAFVALLGDRLDKDDGAPHEVIESLIRRPAAGLKSEGWIVVVCREDGSSTYYLPPTRAHNRVVNADLFCGALEARLP
jgi:hypothetical protein